MGTTFSQTDSRVARSRWPCEAAAVTLRADFWVPLHLGDGPQVAQVEPGRHPDDETGGYKATSNGAGLG